MVETERAGSFDKLYAIGELENHENLRRLIVEIRNQLKAVESQLQERVRSKTVCEDVLAQSVLSQHIVLDFIDYRTIGSMA